MRKLLKGFGIFLAVLVGLVLLSAGGVLAYGQTQWKPVHNRPAAAFTADTSPAGVARGEYLVKNVVGCNDCHTDPASGAVLAGTSERVAEGPMSFLFAPSNLTPHVETGLGGWTDGEIARAIREAVDKDGVQLAIMPSIAYRNLSDADLAAVIGYLRSLPAVENSVPPVTANAPTKAIFALGMAGPKPNTSPVTQVIVAPQPGTVEYGHYLSEIAGCRDCHGPDLTGGSMAVPGSMPAPDITMASEMASWSTADFIATFKTGKTPAGRVLNAEAMPIKTYAGMTEADLADLHHYLQTLTAQAGQ